MAISSDSFERMFKNEQIMSNWHRTTRKRYLCSIAAFSISFVYCLCMNQFSHMVIRVINTPDSISVIEWWEIKLYAIQTLWKRKRESVNCKITHGYRIQANNPSCDANMRAHCKCGIVCAAYLFATDDVVILFSHFIVYILVVLTSVSCQLEREWEREREIDLRLLYQTDMLICVTWVINNQMRHGAPYKRWQRQRRKAAATTAASIANIMNFKMSKIRHGEHIFQKLNCISN